MQEFQKGEKLTASRLNELLGEVARIGSGAPGAVVAQAVQRGSSGQPGPASFNDAELVGKTGRSYFDPAEGMVYGPGDCAGLIAGACWDRNAPELKIRGGILHLPLAHVEEHHEIDPEDDTVEYFAGGVDSIDVREGTAATIEHGSICLPLARSPEYEADDTTGEEYEVAEGWAGMLAAAEFTTGLTTPVLRDGTLQMPMAEFVSGVGIGEPTAVAGAMVGVEYVPELSDPDIRGGVLRLPGAGGEVPLAQFGNDYPSPVAGALRGCEFESSTRVAAHSGVLYFPLAEYGSGVASPITGALAGVQMVAEITEPSIYSGVLRLPQQGGGLQGLRDITGKECTWQQVEGVVGSMVEVAGLSLRTGENTYTTLYLHAGVLNGYLQFNLVAP